MSFQWFIVEGLNPEPWTASQATVGRKGGKNYVQFYKPEQLRSYQESFKHVFEETNPHAVERTGDIQLWLYFWRQLTLNEMFEGRNRRTHVADATNLQKSTEDALQGILFPNDRQIRHVRSTIIEQTQDTVPKILIGISDYDEHSEEKESVEAIAESLCRSEAQFDNAPHEFSDSDIRDTF